jgi:hypothetical protein
VSGASPTTYERSTQQEGNTTVLPYVLGGVAAAAGLWYAVASVWASSVSKHNPDLREGAGEIRYGWRCPRCGRVEAPVCKFNNCGGPLVWVQRGARIKCARCHRNYVFSPMLFRQTPGPATRHCRQCGWKGKITNWKVD